jgi:hypothetical protein
MLNFADGVLALAFFERTEFGGVIREELKRVGSLGGVLLFPTFWVISS